MNDLEISKALALAIGWPQAAVYGMLGCMVSKGTGWKSFDYRDWAVAGPIAEKFDCFPKKINGMWEVPHSGEIYRADTPQRTIALAVIQGVRK